MRYLVVEGSGSWSYGETYRGGPHEVSDEVAAAAEAEGYDWLHVYDEPTDPVEEPDVAGTLTTDDFVVDEPEPDVEEPETEEPETEDEPPDEFPCEVEGCDKSYKSQAALDRHVEMKHASEGEDENE